MSPTNYEFNKLKNRLKDAQAQLHAFLGNTAWMDHARRYATRLQKDVRHIVDRDLDKIRTFVERERKELERFEKQVVTEVDNIRSFVRTQKREIESLLGSIRKMATTKARSYASKRGTTSRSAARPKKTKRS